MSNLFHVKEKVSWYYSKFNVYDCKFTCGKSLSIEYVPMNRTSKNTYRDKKYRQCHVNVAQMFVGREANFAFKFIFQTI